MSRINPGTNLEQKARVFLSLDEFSLIYPKDGPHHPV